MIRFIKFCFLGLLLVQMSACIDQEFDTPPGKAVQVEDISTTTISALKAMHTIGGDGTPIPAGIVVKGIVVSDDNAGSFFKEMVIQDPSGGVLIRINRGDLSTIFRQGKQVFVMCDGLNIGDYNGLIQIGYPAAGENIDRIPDTEIETHIIEGEFIGEIVPNKVSLSDINPSLYSTLIEIQEAEFEDGLIGSTLGIPNGGGTQNRTVEDCGGDEITLRASDFADFAGAPIPSGGGTITGVLSVFGTTNQLTIRDFDDIAMDGPRCDGSGGGGGTVDGDQVDISAIKALFANGTTTGPDGFIEGVVISDVASENTPIRNMVIQDGTGGIIIRFSAAHTFPIGQKLKVATNGVEISEFNGGLQVNTTTAGVEDLGQGALPSARVATIEDILANFDAWESTLVQVNMAEIAGGSTFGDANEISDASGELATFVYNDAVFSGDELPTGEVTVTGIVSEFNVAQIILRNRADVQGGTTGGGGGGGDQVSIADLRTAFAGGAGTAPDGFIEGVVVSDYTTASVNGQNLHIQDGDKGIAIRFTEEHSFPLGAKLKVNLNGTELSEYNGLLQLNNTELSQVESNTAGILPMPIVVTVADLNNNLEDYESTLIKVEGAIISGGTTFNGGLTVTDATGSVEMYTRTQASFSGTTVPSGTVNIIGIASEFNDPQIILRSAADVN
ncbi:MAG: DUF5689 domain-containing protein [Saprospiraceae bacterium]|jgi:hypothetical protein|tara:strand:- start:3538 stop:5556 length:2019 start_codon:yes stop_codon:yes gene_type:complete